MRMISCIVPQTGRMCSSSLQKLGAVAGMDLSDLIKASDMSKSLATSDLEEAHRQLNDPRLTLVSDRKREERPYRVALLSLEAKIGGVDVRVEGAEADNCSSLIRLATADLAIVGFDELLVSMQTYLGRNVRDVTRWGNFNYCLEEPTDVRVAGSANLHYVDEGTGRDLQDFVGFFVIGNKLRHWNAAGVENMLASGKRAYVKGRYEGVLLRAFPGVKTVPVTDVEDAVESDPNGLGVEIVQSGGTAKQKDLIVYGEPLFLSEGLVVADYGKYQKSPELQQVVSVFQPQGFFSNTRINNFVNWYIFLENNLGENWIDKPNIEALFLGSSYPPSLWRLYTLKSRGWAPSDKLPVRMKVLESATIGDQLSGLNLLYLAKRQSAAAQPQ